MPPCRPEGKLIALVVVALGTKTQPKRFHVLGRANGQAKSNVVRDVVHGRVTQGLAGANTQLPQIAGDISDSLRDRQRKRFAAVRNHLRNELQAQIAVGRLHQFADDNIASRPSRPKTSFSIFNSCAASRPVPATPKTDAAPRLRLRLRRPPTAHATISPRCRHSAGRGRPSPADLRRVRYPLQVLPPDDVRFFASVSGRRIRGEHDRHRHLASAGLVDGVLHGLQSSRRNVRITYTLDVNRR